MAWSRTKTASRCPWVSATTSKNVFALFSALRIQGVKRHKYASDRWPSEMGCTASKRCQSDAKALGGGAQLRVAGKEPQVVKELREVVEHQLAVLHWPFIALLLRRSANTLLDAQRRPSKSACLQKKYKKKELKLLFLWLFAQASAALKTQRPACSNTPSPPPCSRGPRSGCGAESAQTP